MDEKKIIRVLIVDDHPLVRRGLALMLKYEPDMEVVAEAKNGLEAVEAFPFHRPDVTLMDLRMPEMGGVAAITAIRKQFPAAHFVVLTTYNGDEEIFQGLRAGAQAYLLKDTPCDELIETVRLVAAGKKHITNEVGAKLAERAQFPELTERELDVLQLVAQGRSNKDIARRLSITEGTAKTHVKAILTKLDAISRTEAVAVAHKRGMIRL